MSKSKNGSYQRILLKDLAAPSADAFVDGPFGSNLKSHEYVADGVRLIQLQNIGDGEWRDENKRFITPQKFKSLERHGALPGDIAIAKMADPVARACIVPNGSKQYVVVADCIRLRIDRKKFDARYIVRSINSSYTRREAEKKAIGSTRVRINLNTLKGVGCLVPKLDEQKAVADILDVVDAAIHQTEAIITKLTVVKEGLLHDLMTCGIDAHGELRPTYSEAPHLYKETSLGFIPRDWDVKNLDSLVDPRRPIVYGILMPGYGYPGGVPVVKVKDISDGKICLDDLLLTSPQIDREYSRSRICSGDLLFTIRGTVGRTAFVPQELDAANITQDTARLAIKGIDARFVQAFLRMPIPTRFIAVHTLGVAVQGINLRDVRRIPIAATPSDEAKAIADRIDVHEARLESEKQQLAKLRLTRLGLIDDLLTGRVRVTPLVEQVEERLPEGRAA